MTQMTVLDDSYRAMKGSVELAVYRKRVSGLPSQGVLVLVHGSSLCAKPTFDLSPSTVEGYSMMEWFALRGFDVWAMDHEGYGGSTVTAGNSDIRSGVADLRALFALIREVRPTEKIFLYGLSSGALRAALFAQEHPHFVERLALDALVWTGRGSAVLEKRREGLPFLLKNTRRLIDRDTLEKGVCGDYPAGFDPSVVRACAIEQIALGDSVPTGTFLDMCVNLPIIDPLAIRMPTLVLRSEYDGIATDEDLLEFFARLPNRDKQFIVSPSLGHSSILGLQRHRVWNALEAFLRA